MGFVERLDRREVRRRFDRRFSSTAMARAYLDIYADRLARAPFAQDVVLQDDVLETPPVLAKIA